MYAKYRCTQTSLQGPVVRKPISANPGLNFKGAMSRNSAKLGNYKMTVKLRET